MTQISMTLATKPPFSIYIKDDSEKGLCLIANCSGITLKLDHNTEPSEYYLKNMVTIEGYEEVSNIVKFETMAIGHHIKRMPKHVVVIKDSNGQELYTLLGAWFFHSSLFLSESRLDKYIFCRSVVYPKKT